VNSSPYALIVEDLDFWQDALCEILADTGYRVCTASNYAEALDALDQNEFHLAVIDPVLDDNNRRNRDGLRVLQYILDRRPNTCAVIVTASDPNRIHREVREMSRTVPLFWKEEWDDHQFLTVVQELMNVKRKT
jgi:DNA-binding NtrC family response regulator